MIGDEVECIDEANTFLWSLYLKGRGWFRNMPTFRKAFFSKWFIKNGGIAEKTQNITKHCWCIFQFEFYRQIGKSVVLN